MTEVVSPPGAPIVASNFSPRKEVRKAERDFGKLSARAKKARKRGDFSTARHIERQLFGRARCAKIMAIDEAGRKMRRKGRPALDGLEKIRMAESLSLVSAPNEAVTVYPKKKSKPGEFRVIHKFEQANTARQLLASWMLKPEVETDNRQYAAKDGRDAACRRVIELMETHPYAAELDIKSFYPTIDRDWLRQSLPMAREITDSVVLSENCHITYSGCGLYSPCRSYQSLSNEARRGLPQGAASSPLIAELVVADIMRRLPEGLVIVNYADNFMVMGCTRAATEQALLTLSSAIRQCPAGRLEVKIGEVRRVCDGIGFLGYRFRRRQGSVSVLPTPEKLGKFEWKVTKAVARLVRDKSNAALHLRRQVEGWLAGHALWAERFIFTHGLLRDLSRAVPQFAQPIMATYQPTMERIKRQLRTSPAVTHHAALQPVAPEGPRIRHRERPLSYSRGA